jgi:hypothetical protein
MKRLPLVSAIVMAMLMFAVPATAQQSAMPGSAPPAAKAEQDVGAQQPVTDPNDPLFGVPPLPKGETSLVGGTVKKIDRIRNRFTVEPYGKSKKMTLEFDERTHIYRDGVETTERGIQRGDRVYVDTMLDGARLFARNVRVVTGAAPADARGQILAYDARQGLMTLRDELSAAPVSFRVTQKTVVTGAQGSSAPMDLVPGSLVAVRFSPHRGEHNLAREVSVLAVPGSSFTFVGTVRHLDLRTGTLVVQNQTDNKTYELQIEPGMLGENVTVGSNVTVSALFTGSGYRAKTVASASRQ